MHGSQKKTYTKPVMEMVPVTGQKYTIPNKTKRPRGLEHTVVVRIKPRSLTAYRRAPRRNGTANAGSGYPYFIDAVDEIGHLSRLSFH